MRQDISEFLNHIQNLNVVERLERRNGYPVGLQCIIHVVGPLLVIQN